MARLVIPATYFTPKTLNRLALMNSQKVLKRRYVIASEARQSLAQI